MVEIPPRSWPQRTFTLQDGKSHASLQTRSASGSCASAIVTLCQSGAVWDSVQQQPATP